MKDDSKLNLVQICGVVCSVKRTSEVKQTSKLTIGIVLGIVIIGPFL